eukprot:258295_1
MRPLVALFFCVSLSMVGASYPKGGGGWDQDGKVICDGTVVKPEYKKLCEIMNKNGQKVRGCCGGLGGPNSACSCFSDGKQNCCENQQGFTGKCKCCKKTPPDCPGIATDWPPTDDKEIEGEIGKAQQEGYSVYDEYGHGYDDNDEYTLNITFTTICIILAIVAFIVGSFIWNIHQCNNMNKTKDVYVR